MAGIGFELRKIQQGNSYLSDLTAYIYGAMVSSGPWLMSVLCLAILGLVGTNTMGKQAHDIFRTTVVYIYAASLIFVGFFQMVTTRHLADILFEKSADRIARIYFTAFCLVLCTGFPLGTVAVSFLELSITYKFLTLTLFILVCILWIHMIFLSALKDYKTIFNAFTMGTAGSILGAWALEPMWGLEGFLLGYTCGQAVLVFILLGKILAEIPKDTGFWDVGLVQGFRKYWELALIGLLYNLGIWIDKFLFWNASDSRLITPFLRTHDLYDAPVFLAYLSIVPAIALFMIKAETIFYEHYRTYYAKIISGQSLQTILEEKRIMTGVLQEGIRQLLVIQGGVTGLCLLFTPSIVRMARLSPLQEPILRICLVGAFLQSLLTILIIVLFYFDFRKRVLVVTALFLAGNTAMTWASIQLGLPFYGYGYCYSCLLALITGGVLLSSGIRDLEYITFAKQPIA